MSIIEVEHLSKTFEYYEKAPGLKGAVKNLFHRKKLYKDAVDDVSFRVEKGEIVGFLGPNGAGKTTTLKMLSGILYPTDGKAVVNGFIPWKRENEYKKSFALVSGQKSQLWPDLPAIDTFELNRNIYELEEESFRGFLAEITQLLDVERLLKVQVRRLSLGERMKMELIAALLHQPSVMFLDEPTIGLDLTAQSNIRSFLKEYNRRYHTTIIITSHYMKDIEDLCDRVVVINQGKNVFDGKLADVSDLFEQRKVVKLKSSSVLDCEGLKTFGVLKSSTAHESTVLIEKPKVNESLKKLVEMYPFADISVENIPLEEGIRLLYERK